MKLEELETMRLKDMEGFEQSECAKKWRCPAPPFSVFFYQQEKRLPTVW